MGVFPNENATARRYWDTQQQGKRARDRIAQDPAVMGGKACIRGLRVTVGMIHALARMKKPAAFNFGQRIPILRSQARKYSADY